VSYPILNKAVESSKRVLDRFVLLTTFVRLYDSERRFTMPEQSELPQQKGKQGKIIIKSRKEQTYMICKRLTSNERPAFPKRAIVTAGMPYGNKNLHFGHVGGMFIHADIFARFLRDLIGKDNVIFLSGTDCYGSPIMESFRKLKEEGYEGSLENYVNDNHEKQKKTLESYGISLDYLFRFVYLET